MNAAPAQLLQRRQGLAAPVRLASTTEISELRDVGIQSDGSLRLGAAATLQEVAKPGRHCGSVSDASVVCRAKPAVR